MNGSNCHLHCNDVWRTALVRFLIFAAPGTNGVAQVMAPELDLSVVAHGRSELCSARFQIQRRVKYVVEAKDFWLCKQESGRCNAMRATG